MTLLKTRKLYKICLKVQRPQQNVSTKFRAFWQIWISIDSENPTFPLTFIPIKIVNHWNGCDCWILNTAHYSTNQKLVGNVFVFVNWIRVQYSKRNVCWSVSNEFRTRNRSTCSLSGYKRNCTVKEPVLDTVWLEIKEIQSGSVCGWLAIFNIWIL